MRRSPANICLCMVVKDEETNLGCCLESVRDMVSEIVMVDTGSIDKTLPIAAQYGAKIIPFDFSEINFSAARNAGLVRAHAPWVLVLDADERLDRSTAPMVEEFASRDENAGYIFERHNHSSDSETPKRDYTVRLFPNRRGYRYRGRVHETIDESILAGGGRLKRTGIRIDHNFASDRVARRRKNLLYVQILKEEVVADPADSSRLDFLAAEYHQLEMFREAEEIAARIVEMRPQDAQAHLLLGAYRLLYRPDWARSRADFMRALELKPGYREAETFLRMLEQNEHETQITSCDC